MQKLAELCVRRPVFATVLVLALVVTGLFAYFQLGVDRFPKVEFPWVTITTVLPGAAPQEVETEVTEKIEGAVNTISGIEEIVSFSSENVSVVSIAYIVGAVCGFLALAYLARQLGNAEFGVYVAASALVNIVAVPFEFKDIPVQR